MLEFKTKEEAWEYANCIFPTDYEEDARSSRVAGYPIYRSPIDHYDYICDLGARLEVNLHHGKTTNLWIA